MSKNRPRIRLLPHDRQMDTIKGKSLMEALIDQNIFLRSDCGGKGTCGKCQVKIGIGSEEAQLKKACKFKVSEDISVEIPASSLLSSHIISKAAASLPTAFKDRFKGADGPPCYGIATDLGTTTIATYLCCITTGKVLSSIAVKNPQALYGDDVMSRISAIGQEKKNLGHLQTLVVRAIEWGIKALLGSHEFKSDAVSKMVVVGNPTMIHILAGIDPASIGTSPYLPVFYETRQFWSNDLGFKFGNVLIQTLPQISGFIGGDILGAALAVDLENEPEGTLLVDLGTNGELILKGKNQFFATSCATGPAFEGASLSCGMQAIPGAISRVEITAKNNFPEYVCINPLNASIKPSGICGTGVISAVAQFCKKAVIDASGRFNENENLLPLQKNDIGKVQYTLVPKDDSSDSNSIFISQKDIRSVQLGKAALITGIEFLLKEAGLNTPEKIIIAGAFGSYIDKQDMITLGMIPSMDPNRVEVAGNSAGAGAIMILCDDTYIEKIDQMALQTNVVDLACNQNFQDLFINRLNFPSFF